MWAEAYRQVIDTAVPLKVQQVPYPGYIDRQDQEDLCALDPMLRERILFTVGQWRVQR